MPFDPQSPRVPVLVRPGLPFLRARVVSPEDRRGVAPIALIRPFRVLLAGGLELGEARRAARGRRASGAARSTCGARRARPAKAGPVAARGRSRCFAA